jgi:coenzyme F420-reducing hydrogenase gamma subunit
MTQDGSSGLSGYQGIELTSVSGQQDFCFGVEECTGRCDGEFVEFKGACEVGLERRETYGPEGVYLFGNGDVDIA